MLPNLVRMTRVNMSISDMTYGNCMTGVSTVFFILILHIVKAVMIISCCVSTYLE